MVPFAPNHGTVQSIAVFTRDMTDLKEGKQALATRLHELKASEALQSVIVDHARAALISTDAKGLIVEFNPSAETMFGRTRAEVLGQPVSLIVMPERFRAPHEAGMERSKPSQRRRVCVNDMVRAATDMLHYGFRSHGIELELALATPLPEVMADGDQIGQVVLSLLVNAQQALAGMSGPRRVHVATGIDATCVWLEVSDTGPGVSPELSVRIFEPFFTTKADGMGTGMGLAVSRSLAREHGGDLELAPASLQGGACFRLRLPLSTGEHPDTIPAALPDLDAPTLLRVLVVDDEPELADLMRDMLESAGYDVATAESGALALELLSTARFDAIVSDLRMPDMDGAALWRAISEQHPGLARRVLFVTGDTLSLEAQKFLKSSRGAGLDKPFSKADLLTKGG
jgi:two-component system NtrC family sensor kinase